MYKEMDKDAFEHHDTWIIGFCPDTDSFFVTDQRCFYWDTEGELEFNSEDEGIEYFENHLVYFLKVNNTLMSGMFTDMNNKVLYLDNNNGKYELSI